MHRRDSPNPAAHTTSGERLRRQPADASTAADIVRELALEGADASAAAHALYMEARRLLSEAAGELLYAPHDDASDAMALLARNALALLPVALDEANAGALNPGWLEDLHRLSRPETDHRRHGRWYTSRTIARYMARRAIAAVASRTRPEHLVALDPACGCGALAVPLLEELVAHESRLHPKRNRAEMVEQCLSGLTIADIDVEALDTAAFRLRVAAGRLAGRPVTTSPRLFHGDVLTAPPLYLAPHGVDLVLMNPPYLGNRYFEQMPDPAAARAALRRSFGWNDDLYAHFLARAWEWLRPGGALCAITSDTFLTIPSKARTRAQLRSRALREIVRVPPAAFAANVNTCITVAVNAPPELFDVLQYVDARRAADEIWDILETEPSPPGVTRFTASGQVYAFSDVPFYRPTPRAVALFERYLHPHPASPVARSRAFVRLGEIAPARDCGINSGNVRHKLFFFDYRDGLERLIQGRQTEKYIVRWDSPAARYRWVDLTYEPDPSVKGIGRGGRPSRSGETWGFRGDLNQHFAAERLFLRQTEDDLVASYLKQNPRDPTFTDNTLFTLLINERGRRLGISYHYLLGLLNSAFLNELYHALSQEEGRAQAQVKVGYVNRLPILVPSTELRGEVEGLVRRAIEAQEKGSPLSAIQQALDTLVAGAYGADDLPADD
jgi:methylase of polypeptide subunit release factors